MLRLAAPLSLLILTALVIPWWFARRAAAARAAVMFSDLRLFDGIPSTWRVRWSWLPTALRVATLVILALAIARPQYGVRDEEVSVHGVDIMLVLDRSSSMRAMDLRPDRLAVARDTIIEFVGRRSSDRLGLVAFAREAYTACPLTLDHTSLVATARLIDFAVYEDDGTAIGLGLAAAINRLKGSDAKSRVIVLLTDGINNAGTISPDTAAELAVRAKIRLYTIGVGTRGFAPFPDLRGRVSMQPVEIDETALTAIAEKTGGRYFRADASDRLREVMALIDRLETSEIKSSIHVSFSDRFELLLWLGVVLLTGELALLHIWLARWP